MNARKVLMNCAGIAGLLYGASANAAITFAPAVNYPTGSQGGPGPAAESMISADVDNDGDADVITADWWGSGIRVFKNNGNGSFGPAIVTSLGTSTGSVSAADFDGDGMLDLAVGTGQQLVILRGNGSGSFTEVERHALSVGGQIQAYAHDVTLDGRVDIVAPTSNGVQVFIGLGNGRFVSGPLTPIYALISAAAVGNFNNDGIPDLVVTDAFTQRVILLRGNGGGSFTQLTSGIVGFGPEDVIAVDLNGDGIDDVATADSFSFTVSVLLSNGQGGFAPATRYTGVQGPVSLRAADFDRDGDLDLAVSSVVSSSVQVYTNSGNGQFGATPQNLPVTNQPQTPAIADYNGDGRPDIAVAGPGSMSILRNTSP
jgi:hypothetical protein